MVVRKRLRAVLVPLALYAVSGAVVAYFMFHAHHGDRGLEAKRDYKAQILDLNQELAALRAERSEWDRRVAMLRDETIDKDLLEERARVALGRVNKDDLVVMIGADGRAASP